MEESPPAAAPPPEPAKGKKGLWVGIVVVVLVIILLIAAALAGLFGPPGAPGITASPKIGTVLPITGALADFGTTMQRAVDLAQTHINDGGGIRGFDLTIVHEDSQTVPTAGRDAATKLINVDGVTAIVGAAASSVSQQVFAVAEPAGVLEMSPASTSPIFTTADQSDLFWRTAPSDALQGKAAGLYADDRGWQTMGVLYINNAYGVGLAEVFRDTFTALGGTVPSTAFVSYEPDQATYTSVLESLFATDFEAVFFVGYPGDGDKIIPEWWANRAEWPTEWLWSEGLKAQDFVDRLAGQGIDVVGIEGTAPVPPETTEFENAFEAFRAAYVAAFGVEPNVFDPHTYDAVFLISLAMHAANSVDAMTFKEELRRVSSPPGTVILPGEWAKAIAELDAGRDIDYSGASGAANFDEFGEVGSDYEVWQVNDQGQIVRIRFISESDLPAGAPSLGMMILSPLVATASSRRVG